MSDYLILSPSYKRSGSCTSHHVFKEKFKYVVHEEEVEKYQAHGYPLLVIPKGNLGNIAKARNWILENAPTKRVIMVDDDYLKMNKIVRAGFKKRLQTEMTQTEIYHMIENGFQMMSDVRTKLWGVNCQDDPSFYRENMPFSFRKIILGTFSAIEISDIRYDESIYLKEDYDFFIQHLVRFKKVLRLNFHNYLVDHQKLFGGCVSYRSQALEKEHFDKLLAKWGPDVVRKNSRTETYNPIIVI